MIIMAVVITWTFDSNMKYNKVSDVLFADLEATANGESAVGKQYYIDNPLSCTAKEAFQCHYGITIPDWIPYVGGLSCTGTYVKEVEFPGSENHCIYTGVKQHSCDYYRCRRNN